MTGFVQTEKGEKMRLIDAKKLAEYKANGISNLTEWQKGWNDAIDTIIEEAPTIDAEPVRHGHWEHLYGGQYKCSNCGAWWGSEYADEITNDFYYCPNCGAKIDGERKEDAKTK